MVLADDRARSDEYGDQLGKLAPRVDPPKRREGLTSQQKYILDMVAKGCNSKTIAIDLNTSTQSVNNCISKMRARGIEVPYRKRHPADEINRTQDVEIIRCMAEGMTALEIGQWLGMATSTVQSRCLRLRREHKAANNAHLTAIALRSGLIE